MTATQQYVVPTSRDTMLETMNHLRTRCEIWTRVMGYHRPVHTWNPGKQGEHADRQLFKESKVEF